MELNFEHPCFKNDSPRVARMHLAVAPRCNIRCSFCNPELGESCIHGCVPGLTYKILSPCEALEHLDNVINKMGIDIKIVGIAGPGEPLANPETFQTLRLIKEKYPDIHLCLSTNGLLLPDKIDEIVDLNVETLTVTVNALTLSTAYQIYDHVLGQRDYDSFSLLLNNQWVGIQKANEKGLIVKVNTVLVPNENDREIPLIAKKAKEYGVFIHNIIPLIPRCDAKERRAPTNEEVNKVRQASSLYINEFLCCKHCRADAIIDAQN